MKHPSESHLMNRAALLFILLLTGSSASAQTIQSQNDRGDAFAAACRTAVKFENDGYEAATEKLGKTAVQSMADMVECYQYLRGFIEGHNMTADRNPAVKQFCIPGGVTHVQLARVMVNAADRYPEFTHYPRETLVEAALKQAFPCGD